MRRSGCPAGRKRLTALEINRDPRRREAKQRRFLTPALSLAYLRALPLAAMRGYLHSPRPTRRRHDSGHLRRSNGVSWRTVALCDLRVICTDKHTSPRHSEMCKRRDTQCAAVLPRLAFVWHADIRGDIPRNPPGGCRSRGTPPGSPEDVIHGAGWLAAVAEVAARWTTRSGVPGLVMCERSGRSSTPTPSPGGCSTRRRSPCTKTSRTSGWPATPKIRSSAAARST